MAAAPRLKAVATCFAVAGPPKGTAPPLRSTILFLCSSNDGPVNVKLIKDVGK